MISWILSCNPSKSLVQERTGSQKSDWKSEIQSIVYKDSVFRNSHTGLLVRKLGTTQDIIDLKSDQYFTPASNTKLLTFLTCLHVLEEHISALKLYESRDSLIIWGTGDPTLLNPFLQTNDFISERLKQSEKQIYFSTSNFNGSRYGSAWSWDDYNYAFQAEMHSLPFHGNVVSFRKPFIDSKFSIYPTHFETLTMPRMEGDGPTILRDEHENLFRYHYDRVKSRYNINRYVPFRTSVELQVELLAAHIGREIEIIDSGVNLVNAENLRSTHVDSLYRLLLQPSDNFVAEQLLLNCGSELFDELSTDKVIAWAKDSILHEAPQAFQWADGSGLSRYNMTSPANMLHVLELIHKKIDQDRLFRLLPTGGESGTIRNYYGAEKPFIHAKTGSLRNNHSLSGYLIGDSGEVYLFSFMNSNYLVSNKDLKGGMEKVLRILKANL